MSLRDVAVGLIALDIAVYLAIELLVFIAKPVELDSTRAMSGNATRLSALLRPIERAVSWLQGADTWREPDWKMYTTAALLWALVSMLMLALLLACLYTYDVLAAMMREAGMGIEYLIVGLIALGIAIYLAVALLRPDKF